jgi:hypothetical protein
MNSSAKFVAALEKSANDAPKSESAELLRNLESALAKILPKVDARLTAVSP